MTKLGEQKPISVACESVPQRKKQSRSSRVELVIARIFAKQRAYPNKRPLRRLDLEDVGLGWDGVGELAEWRVSSRSSVTR